MHRNQLGREFEEILGLAPFYNPARQVDPNLLFHASLLTGPTSVPGNIRPFFTRASAGVYRAAKGRALMQADFDVARFEYDTPDRVRGYLAEQASTNKCQNFNANPDAALTNISISSGPGELRREWLSDDLFRAGLAPLCPSGHVLCVDARGLAATSVVVSGNVGNLNPHTLSAWVYCPQGSGTIGLSAALSFPFSQNTGFELIFGALTPDLNTRSFQLSADIDSLVYFILNKLEQQSELSSDIITLGSAASRALDAMSWPLAGEPHGPNLFMDIIDDIDWGSSAAVTLVNGWAIFDGGQTGNVGVWTNTRLPGLDVGRAYKIIYRVRNATAGWHRVQLDNNVNGTWQQGNGWFFDYIEPSRNDSRIQVQGNAEFVGEIEMFFYAQAGTPILSDAEGMGAFIYHPKYGYEAQGSNNSRHLTLGPAAAADAWVSHGFNVNVAQLTDGVSSVTTSQSYEDDDEMVIAWRWGGGTMSIASKRAGLWSSWDSDSYDGSFDAVYQLRLAVSQRFPISYRNLRIWSEDRGEAWLEAFFSEVAN